MNVIRKRISIPVLSLGCLMATIVSSEWRTGSLAADSSGDSWPCLKNDLKPEDVVSSSLSNPGMSHGKETKVTVDQTLKRLKARCRRGKLIDLSGREIYFYRLAGCWGNPPDDYQQVLQRQSEELQKLRKRYHVIEIACSLNPESIQ